MKRFLLFGFTLCVGLSLNAATTYYSQGSFDPGLPSSWGTMMVGGSMPGSFTTAGDVFIIQNGHTMTTTATWTVGGSGSILNIKNGGTLEGNHSILLTGTFQIDNGGTYIHNNSGSVAQVANSSIFSGAESFGTASNFEIRNWQSSPLIQPLPNTMPGIIWGNLIVNLTVNLGGAWNWTIADATTLTINGNLDIRSTYTGITPRELRFTGIGSQTINVGGNFLISGTSMVSLKQNSSSDATGNVTMQVNGNVSLSGTSQLNLGSPISGATVGVFDLRFKGNFSADAGTTVTSSAPEPYLVANGTSAQTLSCIPMMSCNFRVALGATVNLISSLTTVAAKKFTVCGTYTDNGNSQTFGGPFEVAGGIVNASGNINMGSNFCRSCLGTGTYNSVNATWCTLSGTKGRINFNSNTITFNKNAQAKLDVGINLSTVSDGEVYLTNSIIGFNGAGAANGAVSMFGPATVLSLDGTSYITGTATFSEFEGTLRIGSPDGITTTGNPNGNIRVSGTRGYNGGTTAAFEYFGTTPQVTGDGLPTTISGKLKINNSAGVTTTGVTLSQNTTVSGMVNLTSGRLTTTSTNILTMSDNATYTGGSITSFVNGPMKKIGDDNFIFPIGFGDGSGNIYAPIEITNFSGEAATDVFTAEYKRANPQSTSPYSSAHDPILNHVSFAEYWTLQQNVGSATKQVSLDVHLASFCKDLTKTYVSRWNGSQWTYELTGITNGPNLLGGGFVGGTIQSTGGISGFTSSNIGFTLSTDLTYANNPLPITLISFDASKLTNTKSTINWELAACCSAAAKFEIQRADANKNFTSIGTIGGSATNKLYNYIDNDLKTGVNYYRLKMIEEDGKITYSRIVAVMNGVNGLMLTSLIPTMVTNSTMLTIASSGQQKLDLMITDMEGRIVQKQNLTIVAGNTNIQLSTDRLATGVYQLTGVTAEGKTNVIRFIRQ